jgi:hypothetical protein
MDGETTETFSKFSFLQKKVWTVLDIFQLDFVKGNAI